MKILIIGASGMVGKAALLQCLEDQKVKEVVCLGRSSSGIIHSKFSEILHSDFSDFSSLSEELSGFDGCFYSMGISAAGLKEEEYFRPTYTFLNQFVETFIVSSPQACMIYVSGLGTDSSEKGSVMWARVKGKAENRILSAGFRSAFAIRPGIILPLKGIRSKTPLYQFIYTYLGWFFRIIYALFPKNMVSTTNVGDAVIELIESGYNSEVIEPADIKVAAERHNSKSQ